MTSETCQPFQELLSDLADGEIEGPEAARVEAHVAECASCRADFKLLSGVVMNLSRISEEEVPVELMSRVMREVTQPSWLDRLVGLVLAPFNVTVMRVAVPVVAMVMLAVMIRPLMPADGPGPAHPDQFVSVARWWGGSLLVNEMPHPQNKSGKLGLRPGDSLRTADKVEVTLPLKEAMVEMRPKTSLIMKRDGLYLADGEIIVRVEEGAAPHGEEQAIKVATANAIVIHVGTVFKVNVTGGVTTTEVSQGRVRVYSTTGAAQDLGAGQRAVIDGSGIVSGPAMEAPRDLLPARTGPEEIRSITQSLPGGPQVK